MTRLRVAATVATARTRSPESSSARCASRAVAPVVRTSSHTTSESGRSVRASAARAVGRTPIEPVRLAARSPALRPAWSRDLTSLLEELDDANAMSATPQSSSCRARHPEHGVVAAGAHHRRLGRAPARARCAASGRVQRRTAWARTRPSGVASEKVPCSLCARIIARSRPSYSPAAKQAASPSGHGVGRTGIARWGRSFRQARHRDRPGGAQPTQPPPCTRSSQASSTPAPCTRPVRVLRDDLRRLWIAVAGRAR